MNQASMLMTFFVLMMGAAWFGLETGMFEDQLQNAAPAEVVASIEPVAAS